MLSPVPSYTKGEEDTGYFAASDAKSLHSVDGGGDNLSDTKAEEASIDQAITEETLHRNASNWSAFMNVVCVVAGTGVLQLPYALSEGGWVSVILILLSGFIGVYSGTILIRCLYYKPDRRLSSFPEIGEAAFGKPGLYVTLFFHYLYILGAICIYIILAGDNIDGLFRQVDVNVNAKVWKLIVALVMWAPFVVMKSMREVAVLALFGYVATVVVVIITVVVGFVELSSIHASNTITYAALTITSLPSAIASISFAFSGTVVYPHVEASMKNPRDWTKVLAVSMFSITVLYLIMSVCSYAIWGNTTMSPVLSNLPNGVPKTIALILISLHVILAAPIMLTTVAMEFETSWDITVDRLGKAKELMIRFTFRSLIVAALYGIAIAIPYFSDVLNLVGALSTTMVFFVFPIVFYVRLYGIKVLNWWERFFAIIILILGVVGLIIGSVQAIQDLVRHIQEDQ
ncbi:hypothetical protein H4R33_003006 [Dimargaris cristalligena]|uniref:Transmembrane amino acid transporter protein-domain-containing protein n=1 Tax=Dimargaris cristalligena TaxID=215637 RepID=A0A4P9ZR88_9FUNG|nr:hypothetical protein H4R33_003006 [Dimargaris cristalligena]RKP35907.1 transmembrane amino acid transporter protein-domain-containing protein [Dimargaris cristalligena]|eukprot:RKP35907.1 transmembrane amino acid transporter protein-domain-containing protein [Dimargaris cristalligena]